jgi:hypothetical protein
MRHLPMKRYGLVAGPALDENKTPGLLNTSIQDVSQATVFDARWLHASAQNLLDLLLVAGFGGQYRNNAYGLIHADGFLG